MCCVGWCGESCSRDQMDAEGRRNVLEVGFVSGTSVSAGAWVSTRKSPKMCRPRGGGWQMRAKSDGKTALAKERMIAAFKGLEKGYGNVAITEDQDDAIDDLVADVEELDNAAAAAENDYLFGRWRLVFTNSAMIRFGKGVSGIHLLLPFGRSIQVEQVIEPEDYQSYLVEKVSFLKDSLNADALISGQYKWLTKDRLAWEPEAIRLWFLRFQAESGWRTLGALKVVEITYLDYEIKVERGDAGQVYVWKRVE